MVRSPGSFIPAITTVAGAFASAGDLESGETETVDLDLIGDAKGAEVHISAPPTIYQ